MLALQLIQASRLLELGDTNKSNAISTLNLPRRVSEPNRLL